MNMFMAKRFGRTRKLHTFLSQETIKPSSPTPLHLKTHNLSLLDLFAANFHMPKVFFYKDYNNANTNMLKMSLSKCLTQYYPFAGRFPPSSTSCIDCNDEGVEFIEATNDIRIDEYILIRNRDEVFEQLIPSEKDGLNSLLKVQVNYLADGGVALAVSISHKIADGFTSASFINNWASIARGQSPINPTFISSSTNTDMIKIREVVSKDTYKGNYVAQRFTFPNSKLKELKEKVITMGTTPLINPTRVELVTSLIFKCVMRAAIMNSGNLKPLNLIHCVNMRNKLIKHCPETAAGNVMTMVAAKMPGSSELMLNEIITELRKEKMKLEGLKDEQEVGQQLSNMLTGLEVEPSLSLISTSLCRFPFYDVDFGFGKPIKVLTRFPDLDDNGLTLLDTPKGDGIEAIVHMHKEVMPIFEKDEELLTYVEEK